MYLEVSWWNWKENVNQNSDIWYAIHKPSFFSLKFSCLFYRMIFGSIWKTSQKNGRKWLWLAKLNQKKTKKSNTQLGSGLVNFQ